MADLPDLGTLRTDDLRRAVALYLEQAYPSGTIPEVIRRRLSWPEDVDLATLLSGPPFERNIQAGPDRAVTYALRRPDPLPGVFGYHEVFHALVIIAAALQYAVIAFWVLPQA